MSAYSVSVDIAVPPESVYRFIADDYAVNHPRWDPGIVHVDLDGPVRPGVRGRETRRFLGRTSTTRFEALVAEPPSRLVLRDEPAIWALTRTYDIVRLGPAATRLTLMFDMQPRALGFRLAYPLIRPLLRRQVRATVEHLGEVLARSAR